MRKLTKSEFIEKSKIIHNNKYDYSSVDYVNLTRKVEIICDSHGAFMQEPRKHMLKQGCPKCCKNHKKCIEDILFLFKHIHGNRYDYSLVEYKGMHSKVSIICSEHNIFDQTPHNHLKNQGCPSVVTMTLVISYLKNLIVGQSLIGKEKQKKVKFLIHLRYI